MSDRDSFTNNLVFDELGKCMTLSITSKCPEKWLFVDLETGDIWHHSPIGNYPLMKAPDDKINELKSILKVKK